MDAKEEGILLGELKGFKESTLRELSFQNKELSAIKTQVEALNKFKWKVTGVMASIVFLFEGAFQVARFLIEHKK